MIYLPVLQYKHVFVVVLMSFYIKTGDCIVLYCCIVYCAAFKWNNMNLLTVTIAFEAELSSMMADKTEPALLHTHSAPHFLHSCCPVQGHGEDCSLLQLSASERQVCTDGQFITGSLCLECIIVVPIGSHFQGVKWCWFLKACSTLKRVFFSLVCCSDNI